MNSRVLGWGWGFGGQGLKGLRGLWGEEMSWNLMVVLVVMVAQLLSTVTPTEPYT